MAVSFNIEEGQALPPELLVDLERLAAAALLRHGLPATAEVSLMLCADETIHALNRQWRSVDSPTDVLSFPLLEDGELRADNHADCGAIGRTKMFPHPSPLPEVEGICEEEGEGIYRAEETCSAEGELLLGDVVISMDRAAKQAADFGHSLKRELFYLFTHGILHLLGYDHEVDEEQQEMRAMEELLLAVVGVEHSVL